VKVVTCVMGGLRVRGAGPRIAVQEAASVVAHEIVVVFPEPTRRGEALMSPVIASGASATSLAAPAASSSSLSSGVVVVAVSALFGAADEPLGAPSGRLETPAAEPEELAGASPPCIGVPALVPARIAAFAHSSDPSDRVVQVSCVSKRSPLKTRDTISSMPLVVSANHWVRRVEQVC
jgi:hypothetical protein